MAISEKKLSHVVVGRLSETSIWIMR